MAATELGAVSQEASMEDWPCAGSGHGARWRKWQQGLKLRARFNASRIYQAELTSCAATS